ncbi:tRNA (adenosine(37)-N6)-dimethylallyltransferase MiaA [Candidatus Kaiserbacteria bacterium RIFCSPHIGHO2_01_FULL_56_24]|uniref:tRNA dimethylallyltransferase n=1 Tax=Candidatus Kaiserbacteria bacterium RIFCSPHIGHO2_01_FULL_56_24 TaxID=1798487 RepID=A0A1F6DH70_9BACT|nr:MAG: tRNA (adenosine(37)-N6)-dimethylallyltransferase MiaA [Candidatus Kaiserbacteria bacterium RIFCSPHIGHO2_01_FULL_56_24]
MKQKILVIVGPTASGKSALAVQMALEISKRAKNRFRIRGVGKAALEAYKSYDESGVGAPQRRRWDDFTGAEVISADSRQVYKGLDIGTGKITKKEMRGIPHHLLDVTSPKKIFTANDFLRHGRKAIDDILSRGKLPIICGGTGFYIDALLGRVVLPDVPANPKLRAQLQKKSAAELFAMLKKIDPRRAKDIDSKNPVRLVRAIEIVKALGKVPAVKPKPLPYAIEWIGIKPDDKTLRARIHKRLLQRMKQGMVQEARRLHKAGLSYKRMHVLGLEYRYLALYLQKKITKPQLLDKIEQGNWHYAKRQMTYWRRNKDIKWRAVWNDVGTLIQTQDTWPHGQRPLPAVS